MITKCRRKTIFEEKLVYENEICNDLRENRENELNAKWYLMGLFDDVK